MFHRVTSFLILCLLLFGFFFTKSNLDHHMDQRDQTNRYRFFPSPEAAGLLSIGYREALGDVFWIEAVNYLGNQIAVRAQDYSQLHSFISIISHLDPLFEYFYDWAATAFVYNTSPLTRTDLVASQRIANAGIKNLASIGRYNGPLILKAAFNYALEIHLPQASYEYFRLLGRSSPETRDYLLVAASYASRSGDRDVAQALFLEFFAYKIFEVQNQNEFRELFAIVSSPAFNTGAADFIASMRLAEESNEEIKEIVRNRLETNPLLRRDEATDQFDIRSREIQRLLRTDTSRNWMPPTLHLLLRI